VEGYGGDWFDVALRIHVNSSQASAANLTSENQRIWKSTPEVQTLQIATTIVREIQSVTLTGVAAGAFALVGAPTNADSTPKAIAFNADAVTMRSVVNGAGGCSNIDVTRVSVTTASNATGYKWTFTFNCPTAASFTQLSPVSLTLQPQAGQTYAASSTRLQSASTPASGSFRLAFNGMNTTLLSYASGSGTIQNALMALDASINVEVTGSTRNVMDGGSWLITFWGPYGDLPLLSAYAFDPFSGAQLYGTNASITVSELHAGSENPFYWPAPMEWFRTGLPVQSVQVVSNGLPAECDVHRFNASNYSFACGFVYDDTITPTVTSVSTTSATAGDSLTITGTNFLTALDGSGLRAGGSNIPIWALNKVYLNDSLCNVTAASSTSIVCIVADAAYGSYELKVEVGLGRGFARAVGGPFSVSYAMVVSSISPSSGSKAGGTLLTLSGTGFRAYASGNVVLVGGQMCSVISSTFSQLSCRTPASSSDSDTSVAVVANGVTAGTQFQYLAGSTPLITEMVPRVLSTAISGIVNLTLTGVPAASTVVVSFGGRPCRINAVSYGVDTLISCTLVRGPALSLPQVPVAPIVEVGTYGYANASNVALDTAFRVDSMSLQYGSLEGGSEVTITGTGFSPLGWPNEVIMVHTDAFGNEFRHSCEIIAFSADGNNMTAIIPFVPFIHRSIPARRTPDDDLHAVLWVKVNNITAPCAPELTGCNFTQSFANTPILYNISVLADANSPSGYALIAQGDHFVAGSTHVYVGVYTCIPEVVYNSSTLRCLLPVGIAGTVGVSVHVNGVGTGRGSASYTFPLAAGASISAASGSISGGTSVVLTGAGFADDNLQRNVVMFGTSVGVVVSATTSTLTVLTPPRAGTITVVNVTVLVLDDSLLNTAASVSLMNAFVYNSSLPMTPTLASLTPTSGVAGTILNVTGNGFGTDPTNVFVSIGGVLCDIVPSSFRSNFLQCQVGFSPAGTQRLLVTVAGAGLARGSGGSFLTFTSLLQVTGVFPQTSSVSGGALLTFSGRGFPVSSTVASSSVAIGNTACNVTSSNYTTLQCVSAPLLTQAALTDFPGVFVPGMLMGVIVPSAAHDMNTATYFTSCTVNLDLGAHLRGVVTSISFYPRFHYTASMRFGTFSGSNDRTSWTTLLTLDSQVLEGWNDVNIQGSASLDSLTPYRYLRFQFAGGVTCTASEIEFRGFGVSPFNGSSFVNVTVDTADASQRVLTGTVAPVTSALSSSFNVQYSSAATPWISSISPNKGTALGGTWVTITGTNFPTNVNNVDVQLNGIPCAVQTATATQVECITSFRTSVNDPSIELRSTEAGSAGLALYDNRFVYFRYLDRWSSLTTWKYQEPPVDGDTVVIPAGQSVLLDVNTPILFLLLIQGVLIVDRQDLTMDSTYIFVHGGTFTVGSEAEPFLNHLTITLHGDRHDSIELPEIGVKVLAVMDRNGMDDHMNMRGDATHTHVALRTDFAKGVLELHGEPRMRTWTTLSASAFAGTDTLQLSEPVDWRVGDHIFVTCPGDMNGIEEKVVSEVMSAQQLRVSSVFGSNHISKIWPAGQYGFNDVDMRAEVGLITRNVIVQGDSNSRRQFFGSHMGAFHGGIFKVENIEIRFCGQSGGLGRYCSHSHMRGDAPDSYVRFNSIHDSNQRAITIHATNYFTAKGNSIYNVLGHTVFVEDGVEQYNIIEDNLVAGTHPCNFCTDSGKLLER
jgi:hypothetical protein